MVTYTGHHAAERAGGIVLAREELDVARLGLRLLARRLKLLSGLGAQLLRLVLRIVDYRVGRVQLEASLIRCRTVCVRLGLRQAARVRAAAKGMLERLEVRVERHLAGCGVANWNRVSVPFWANRAQLMSIAGMRRNHN